MSDVSKEVFGDFLLFMYTGRFQNLDTTALELLQLAKRFNINIIKQICMSHLKLTLTKEKAPQIFQVSHQQGLVELKMAAFQRIQKYVDYFYSILLQLSNLIHFSKNFLWCWQENPQFDVQRTRKS